MIVLVLSGDTAIEVVLGERSELMKYPFYNPSEDPRPIREFPVLPQLLPEL